MSESVLEEKENLFRAVRVAKLDELRDLGVNPYPYQFARTHKLDALQDLYKDLDTGVETQDEVCAWRDASAPCATAVCSLIY